MIDTLNVLISGARDGCLYGLLALAIVLIYKSTGILNFALPNLGMVGAVTLQALIGASLAPPLAFLLAFGAAIVLGLAIERLALRPVQSAPPTSRMIVSLAAATLIESVVALFWGSNREGVVTFPFFDTTPFSLGNTGILIAPLDLAALASCLLIAGGLYLFFRVTTIGIAVRACAERPESVGLLGISQQRIALLSWSAGALIATLAACFFAADQGSIDPTFMENALVWALLAATLGSLTSLWGALLGGIILGMADQGIQLLSPGGFDLGSYHRPALFMALIVLLMARKRGLFSDERARQV
ncbi:MAG TPA: branched-chain amino acid ABC transporter permease [Chloroflexota bacterium]|nr:branched-chain amino acid ABC transporter permease [Chloroflexota bacterium]